MMTLPFVTSNSEKVGTANAICRNYGLNLSQLAVDIDEIQGEDSEIIARDKAQKAYKATRKPVVINDDSWSIPGLNGFPGPYMKSIVQWFQPKDFIHLTTSLTDRRIFLQKYVVYVDTTGMKVFYTEHAGTLSREVRGKYGVPSQKVIIMDYDGDKTLSEVYDAGLESSLERIAKCVSNGDAWADFAKWYTENHT